MPFTVTADDIIVSDGMWKITFLDNEKAFRINVLNEDGTSRKCVVNHSFSTVKYDNAEGVERVVNTKSFARVEAVSADVDDVFGRGRCHTFTFSAPDNGDEVTMVQRFCIYPACRYMVTDLSVSGDASIRSNYLAPVSVEKSYMLYPSAESNRMLKVPFDNDGFLRYHKFRMDRKETSYEVSALYEGESRNGLVLGSVEHDRWKSAVTADMAGYGTINGLCVYSGVSDWQTRDLIPHGKVKGPVVTSARMFVGYYDDWREGMEEYADANNLVVPRTETWTHGTPFGWQSWGVLAEKCSYESASEIIDYYHEVLQPGGFKNSQGNVMISLDAGDGMDNTQHSKFIKKAKEYGQMVGCYSTPFSMWCGENPNWDDVVYTAADGTKHTRRDVVLHADGKPIWYDGAYCLDPTHPFTKSNMRNFLRSTATYGFKYVKMDFVNCGIIQADSYFNKDVTTAVEAYNEGMDYVKRQMDQWGLFGALSIAPLFPYQYANSRRISCDTWGSINWAEFSMNAISGGWWTDRLYQYNDPDGLVLVGANDQINNTEGENRARYTNGACSGMMLVADNFSLNDDSGRGWARKSRERSLVIMLNKDINEMADMGRSFRPVYGYKEHNNNNDGAENFFMYHTPEYLYVAVINYSKDTELKGEIAFEALDIVPEDFSEVRELWTNEMAVVKAGALPYAVPKADARVYRFRKNGGDGISSAVAGEESRVKVASIGGGVLMVYSDRNMSGIKAYDLQGRLVCEERLTDRTQVEMKLSETKGLVILRVTMTDGTEQVCKVSMR